MKKIKNTVRLSQNAVILLCLFLCLSVSQQGQEQGQGCPNDYTQLQIFNSPMYTTCVPDTLLVPNCLDNRADFNNQNEWLIIKCFDCEFGYILQYEYNVCTPLVTHCAHYFNENCTDCIQGYSLTYVQNEGQKCNPDLPLNCSKGYTLVNGTCRQITCQNFYYYNSDIGICIPGYIPNCTIYSLQGISCLNCLNGYYLDAVKLKCIQKQPTCPPPTNQSKYVIKYNVCIKIDINCQEYLDDGYCYQCALTYYALNGKCYTNQTIPSSILCSPDYILMGEICVKRASPTPISQMSNKNCPCFDQCVVFNNILNICEKCATGYIPQDDYCMPLEIPGQCLQYRQWPGGVNGRCIQISSTCDSFVKATGQCTTCFSPFVLVSPGVCGYKQNQTCLNGFVKISESRCIPSVPNCKTYSPITGKCLTCQNNYQIIIQSGICNPTA